MAQVVDSTLAEGCVKNYEDVYLYDPDNANSAAAITAAYTDSVSFPISDVLAYIKANPTCDTLTIVPGVYTADFAEQYGTKEGRLSMFLYATTTKHGGGWGNPVPPNGPPLNVGENTP